MLVSCILYPPFRTQLPKLAIRGFCPRGVLLKPHQCSIAFLEPCSKRDIRTNGKRALAAVAFIGSITRGRPQVTGYSIRGGPVAKLVTAIVLWQRGKQPYLLVGWLWYLTMLLPTIGIVQAGRQGTTPRHHSNTQSRSPIRMTAAHHPPAGD